MTSASSPTCSARTWAACCFSCPRASTTPPRGWTRSSASSTRAGATSSSSDTAAGGTRACMTLFGKPASSSAPAAAPRLPDELIKTADDVYLRFHGTTNVVPARLHRRRAGGLGGEGAGVPPGPRLGVLQQRPRSARHQERRRVSPTSGRRLTTRTRGGSVPRQVQDRARCVTPPEESREASAARPSLRPPRRLRP